MIVYKVPYKRFSKTISDQRNEGKDSLISQSVNTLIYKRDLLQKTKPQQKWQEQLKRSEKTENKPIVEKVKAQENIQCVQENVWA